MRLGVSGRCGALVGSLVLGAVLVASPLAAVPTPQQISVDLFPDTTGQHETAVEPDSFSFGNDVVAVFQVGRMSGGGASGIGFATSHDGGSSWRSGSLPVPAQSSLTLVSDPAIAYDRRHGAWIASVLGGRAVSGGLATSLLVSRSTDAINWTTNFVVPDQGLALHDKNWIACDNGASSPRAGRCYVVWTAPFGLTTALAISSSDDGGQSWAKPTTFSSLHAFGVQPIVRPDGTLVVIYATGEDSGARIEAVRSTNGGRTFGAPSRVAALHSRNIPGIRLPPFHSAEIARDGRIFVAWPDCRYRRRCGSDDIVSASSTDGRKWTSAFRVPTGPALAGLDHVLPGLAVDATTAGARTALGLTFITLSPSGCGGAACSLQPFFVSSPDAGRSWSAPQQLESPAPAASFPLAPVPFAGDYISTSFAAGGTAVPVFPWASGPFDGRFHQGIYATAIPPLAATPAVQLGIPRVAVGVRIFARAAASPTEGARVVCRAVVGRRSLRVVSAKVANGIAVCAWRASKGRVTGSLRLVTPEGQATRRFTARVR